MNLFSGNAFEHLDDLTEATDYALIGPRDTRTHETRTKRFPFSTVCHLGRDFGDGVWRSCTGTLIGPRIVLSAGHCLYSHRRRRAPQRIMVSPGRSNRDTKPYGSVISRWYYVPRRYVGISSPRDPGRRYFDYGIILLPRGFPGIKRFMEVQALSSPALEKLKYTGLITIAGYPGDRPLGTLWRHTERLKRITPRRLLYSVDTCPGHSGSPIWYADSKSGRRVIIGVHTSGILDELGRSYGCAKGTILAPPGMMNSGVRITSEVLANIRNPDRRIGGIPQMIRLP